MEFKDLGVLIIDEDQKFGGTQRKDQNTANTSGGRLTLLSLLPFTLQFNLMGTRRVGAGIINTTTATPPADQDLEIMVYNEDAIR